MKDITLVRVDIVKNNFQIHSETAMGKKIHNRSLSRNKFRVYMESLSPFSVGMEACGSSHY